MCITDYTCLHCLWLIFFKFGFTNKLNEHLLLFDNLHRSKDGYAYIDASKIALRLWRFSRTMNPSAEIPIRHVLIDKDMLFLVDAPSHERNQISMVHPMDEKHLSMTCW